MGAVVLPRGVFGALAVPFIHLHLPAGCSGDGGMLLLRSAVLRGPWRLAVGLLCTDKPPPCGSPSIGLCLWQGLAATAAAQLLRFCRR